MHPAADLHDDPSTRLRRGLPALVLLAGAVFSLTLYLSFGYHSNIGIALLGLGVASLALAAVLAGRVAPAGSGVDQAILAWAAVTVALAASSDWWSAFVRTSPHEWAPATAKWLLVAGLAGIVAGAWRDHPALAVLRPACIAIAFVLGAWWTIEQSPSPLIDVWHMHQAAARDLAGLDNPYEVRFANPYRPEEVVPFYAYPPVTLLIQLPFHVLLGDVRYATLCAAVLAAFCGRRLALLAGLRPAVADAAATVLLLQGRPWFQLEQGYTEPILLALLALAALAWARRSPMALTFLGLGLAAKQFLWVHVPALALVPGVPRRHLVRAVVVLAAVFLPFLLWDPAAFVHGVLEVHLDGTAARVAYPGYDADEPWPMSSTLAKELRDQHDLDWPLWMGLVGWGASAAAFVAARRKGVGTLLLCAGAGVALLGYLGSPFHPNYIWLLPGVALLGLLTDLADSPRPAAPAEPAEATDPAAA